MILYMNRLVTSFKLACTMNRYLANRSHLLTDEDSTLHTCIQVHASIHVGVRHC
jgi:hypothetical protein